MPKALPVIFFTALVFHSQAAAPLLPAPVDNMIQSLLKDVSQAHIQNTIEKLVSFTNRNTLAGMEGKPAHTGTSAAADWIEQELKSYSADCGGCLEVKRDSFIEQPQARISKPTNITNVYAVLRGSDPAQAQRMNLVTGHYDSRNTDVMDTEGTAPGANDDASGVAVSLECARVLSKHKWPSTLVFVAVAGEEQGLNGSRHLARLAKQEGWRLEGVLNNDIVGGNTTPGDTLQDKTAVRVFSEGIPAASTPERTKALINRGLESDSPSRELARAVHEVAETYSRSKFKAALQFRRDRYLRGGDHTSFNAEGFAAIRLTEWREDFDHQHHNIEISQGKQFGDLIKFVDFTYVRNVARLNAAALAVLASAPGLPTNVHLETTTLDNDSTIQWDFAEAAPAGTVYEVVWRETTASDWQFGAPAQAANRLTLPISKDNVIFGVRSVDAAGHRSPAVVAE